MQTLLWFPQGLDLKSARISAAPRVLKWVCLCLLELPAQRTPIYGSSADNLPSKCPEHLGSPTSPLHWQQLHLQDGDAAQPVPLLCQGKPGKAAPALGKGWGKGGRAGTPQMRGRDTGTGTEGGLQLWEAGGSHGALPQPLLAARAALQAPDRAADIPSQRSQPGSQGEGQTGSRDAARQQTQGSTEGPSPALSTAPSQLREKNEGKKTPATIILLFLPFQDIFLSVCDREGERKRLEWMQFEELWCLL